MNDAIAGQACDMAHESVGLIRNSEVGGMAENVLFPLPIAAVIRQRRLDTAGVVALPTKRSSEEIGRMLLIGTL